VQRLQRRAGRPPHQRRRSPTPQRERHPLGTAVNADAAARRRPSRRRAGSPASSSGSRCHSRRCRSRP
jgi:hypothetical protein